MKPESAPIGVLLMARELDQGGLERDVAKLAMHLDRTVFETHVASYSNSGMRYEELRAAGIPLLHLPVEKLVSGAAIRAGMLLGKYLVRHRIQVVHSYDVTCGLAIPVARLLRIPVVLSSQLSYRDILDKRTQTVLKLTDPLVDGVVVNCKAIRDYMVQHEGVPRQKVELCYNGVDISQFYPATVRKPEILAGVPIVIGTLCALRPEKNLRLLQEGFALARKPKGTKLVIVGSGVELPKLKQNADRIGIADASVFIPATVEVVPWLRAMDIFVLPSYSEAFSNALIEAMACGCAVIGSRVGGTPELIGNDERGLLFSSGNREELAQKIALLSQQQSLRRELADRAVRFVRANLTIQRAADRVGETYRKLLARRGAIRYRRATTPLLIGARKGLARHVSR